MLPDKVTKKISEIATDVNFLQLDSENILNSFKALKLSPLFSEFQNVKRCGYSLQSLLSLLIWSVFNGSKTVNSSLPHYVSNGTSIGKDAFFRLKNNSKINWRRLLWYFCYRFETITSQEEVVNQGFKCLIFDDTLLSKTGRKIEKIGYVHDHVTNTFKLGFKLLVALYWDGTSGIPVDFSLCREKGKRADKPYGMSQKEHRRQFNKKRMKDTESSKRTDELDISKIELAVRMLYRTITHMFAVDYVLCDSWFTCQSLVRTARSLGVHLIGMYKFAFTRFRYQGKELTYKEINQSIKTVHRCRRMKLQYKTAHVLWDELPVTLFFSRQGTNGKWKVLLTTDTKLTFIKMIEIYSIRWTIEVFNKEAKQFFNLGGCQSSDFDAHIADVTISMLAYILATLRYRYDHYESMGQLFRAMNADNLQQTLDKRIWELFIQVLNEICLVLNKDIDEMLELIMTNHQMAILVERMLAVPPNEVA
jgi:hypothetical protein